MNWTGLILRIHHHVHYSTSSMNDMNVYDCELNGINPADTSPRSLQYVIYEWYKCLNIIQNKWHADYVCNRNGLDPKDTAPRSMGIFSKQSVYVDHHVFFYTYDGEMRYCAKLISL